MLLYDFQTFLKRIGDLDLVEMVATARREAEAIESVLFPGQGRRGISKEHRFAANNYLGILKGFIFFLERGMKPEGINVLLFRPVIEKLVAKGQLKSEILKLFEEP